MRKATVLRAASPRFWQVRKRLVQQLTHDTLDRLRQTALPLPPLEQNVNLSPREQHTSTRTVHMTTDHRRIRSRRHNGRPIPQIGAVVF